MGIASLIHVIGACTQTSLRLRGIMIGRHFQANMKVQTAMCKDNNNSKRRAATYVIFDIYRVSENKVYTFNEP